MQSSQTSGLVSRFTFGVFDLGKGKCEKCLKMLSSSMVLGRCVGGFASRLDAVRRESDDGSKYKPTSDRVLESCGPKP